MNDNFDETGDERADESEVEEQKKIGLHEDEESEVEEQKKIGLHEDDGEPDA